MAKSTRKDWTVTEVADRFEEAVRTLRRLPKQQGQGFFNVWPPIVRTVWEQMAMEKMPLRLGPPLPDAISRMEETFTWIFLLEHEDELSCTPLFDQHPG